MEETSTTCIAGCSSGLSGSSRRRPRMARSFGDGYHALCAQRQVVHHYRLARLGRSGGSVDQPSRTFLQRHTCVHSRLPPLAVADRHRATSSCCKVGVSAPGVDTAVICSKITEGPAARRRGNKGVSAPGVDTNSAARRRSVKSASLPGVDDAASSVGGCKRPTPGKLACSRAAGLHEEAICNQAGLDCVRPRKEPADGYDNGNPSKPGPGRGTSGAGLYKKKRQRKQHKLRKSRSGTETLQEMSAGQTSDTTSSVETLNVLTRTRYWRPVRVNGDGESSDECVGVDVASSHVLDALREGPVRWTHRTDMHPFGSRKDEERSGGVEATSRCEYH
ncbi:hypothetical protein PC128_g27093 [Phytophthora cactorum]|nr:hypothetical protein PC128_g27093 [Phytophthora cactorum]